MNAMTEQLPEAEDIARANLYALLARLLYAAPDDDLLRGIALAGELGAPGAPLAEAWRQLQAASVAMEAEAAREEFEQVFIGLGQGEVMPYMSWHLTGFLMEEPLARLRERLEALGLARFAGVGEPEDHMAALCEVMRLLVAGDGEGAPAALGDQRDFFARFIEPWYAAFAAQLAAAPSANYYRAVARLLKAFLDVEAAAFDIGN